MSSKNKTAQIANAVREFFGTRRYVYATPSGPNYSANFYGDTPICKLNKTDVNHAIQAAFEGWDWDNSENPLEDAINTILDDLQYDRPTKTELGL